MRGVGPKGRERPLRWRPLLVFLALAVLVMVAVQLLFVALGLSGWIAAAIGGAVIGGALGYLYPRLHDRLERQGSNAP